MVPLQLTLKNFLSYRETSLDFRGLHTACICGANGAGKSSLLEAITWVLWGQSRAANDDDVIHGGADNVRVDFQFINNQQTFRVIRSHPRGRSSSLEFQIESGGNFRTITAKGLRATQETIISYLKLDYDTFINSAYLRQGRADEFMLRRPNERKQILADLLKLDQYQTLAERARDIAKQVKGQAEQLELNLQPLDEELERRGDILSQQTALSAERQQLQTGQEKDLAKLQQLQAREHQRQAWQQQLTWQQGQYQSLSQECDRLQQERGELQRQLQQLETLIGQEAEITHGYQKLLQLQQQEEILSAKFQTCQDAQQQKQQLEAELSRQTNELNLQLRQAQARLEALEQQETEVQEVLSRAAEVQQALEQLHRHRQRLRELDSLQHQVAPRLQRCYALQTDIERAKARLSAQLEQLQGTETGFSSQIARVPQLREKALQVDVKIQELDKKQVYHKRVKEKGVERRNFQGRLQEKQLSSQEKLEELARKRQLLEVPYAVCPLCERELDEHHRQQVIEKNQTEQKELQEQIWVLQEQIATCERELQILRGEYQQLERELADYASLQQQFGQLEAQLEAVGKIKQERQQVQEQIKQFEQALTSGNYALDLQSELQLLTQELQRLNYDEQTHALVRGEAERWRWAEIKQTKIEDASRRQANINQQKPKLSAEIARLTLAVEQLHQRSEIKLNILRLEREIGELGYERSQHQDLLNSLRQSQVWQLRYAELQQAKQQHPQVKTRLQELEVRWQHRWQEREEIKQHLEGLAVQIGEIVDCREEIQALEMQVQQRRLKLDELLAQQGRIEQSLTQLDNLKIQYNENRQKLKELEKKHRIYQELSQAFGKNGIQALMIENILPQLEAETNQILARLTGNQLHVQFLTQKASRSGNKKGTAKLIDTLEILIADSRGTRAYETYSGGEAFRINFSIRLALAQLLAQRAGTSLQMLIIDEGFGTQDAEGCDRLIAAINAIAGDFSCILAVTHIRQFKEAFQHRIEVYKTNDGSQLSLLS
jgi:exonuclease SbcC